MLFSECSFLCLISVSFKTVSVFFLIFILVFVFHVRSLPLVPVTLGCPFTFTTYLILLENSNILMQFHSFLTFELFLSCLQIFYIHIKPCRNATIIVLHSQNSLIFIFTSHFTFPDSLYSFLHFFASGIIFLPPEEFSLVFLLMHVCW